MSKITELLKTPTERLGKLSRFLVFQVKLWSTCGKLLKRNRSGQQAAALSYNTIFGLVPLAIVMLLIFQMLPAYAEIGEQIKNFIYKQANFAQFTIATEQTEDEQQAQALTGHLDELVEKFFTGTKNKGSVTIFSVLLVIWAAIALLSTIEKAFNNIWHLAKTRSFLHRVINYWALLTLGPLLFGAGLYLSAKYIALGQLQETIFSVLAPNVVSFLVATVALFLLYYILPNTKVSAKAAIWSAAVAALVWVVAKVFYSLCVTELGLYRSIYGALALIPITVMWIYISWLIVLFGLHITYTTQHLKTIEEAEREAETKSEQYFIANEFTAINIIKEIASAFEQDKGPVEIAAISSRLDLPGEFAEKFLNHLVDKGLLARTSDPKAGFLPARAPANIRLSEIAEAVADAGLAQTSHSPAGKIEQINQAQKELLAKFTLSELLEQ